MHYLDGFKACPFCKTNLEETEVSGGDIRLKCPSCHWIHWENPIPTAVVLIPVEQGVLLVERAINPQIGDWCMPGGYVNKHETPKQTAVREVKEETGLDVTVEQLGDPFITDSNHLVTVFHGTVIGGTMKAGDDAAELRIYAPDALPANIAFPQHRTRIKEYFAKDNQYYCPSPTLVTWFCLICMALIFGISLFMRYSH